MYSTVLFDLDGTLTDPQQGILKSVRYALEKEGFSTRPDEDLTWVIGPPVMESFSVLAGTQDQETLDRLIQRYRERFSPIGLYENSLYANVPHMLRELVQAGTRLFVATSKPTVFAKKILDHFSIADFFIDVVGSELDGTRCAKAEVIQHVVQTHGLSPSKCVMVGDRKYDILGARANRMDSIGVLSGYGSMDELQSAGATHILEFISDIATLVLS